MVLDEMSAKRKTGSVKGLEDWMVEHLSAIERMKTAQEEVVPPPKESDDRKWLRGSNFVAS